MLINDDDILISFQVLAMDYVTANPDRMESLLQLHSDLITFSILDAVNRYPCLARQPVHVYIERNTSHAHAAFIGKSLESQFKETNIDIVVEKECSKDGREKTGIWTKNKSNLIHVAQLLLDTDLVSIANDVVQVCGIKESENDSDAGNYEPTDAKVETEGSSNEIKDILRLQLTHFRRVVQIDGKQNMTGKLKNSNDDLAMAFILWLAWSCYLIANIRTH